MTTTNTAWADVPLRYAAGLSIRKWSGYGTPSRAGVTTAREETTRRVVSQGPGDRSGLGLI